MSEYHSLLAQTALWNSARPSPPRGPHAVALCRSRASSSLSTPLHRLAALLLPVGAILCSASPALAIPCSTLPAPVYGLGGSAAKPLLGKVGAALAGATPASTVVFQSPGACFGIYGLLDSRKLTGTSSYWTPDGKEETCDLPTEGVSIDFANMGNSAPLCPDVQTPIAEAGIGDFLGPVQAFNLIVPLASSQLSISAEAAYYVFGLGAAGGVAPWTDEEQLYVRNATSAAQLFIAEAIGVPAEKFRGQDMKTNGATVTGVGASTKPESALGLVGGEVADASRESVRTLAYQHRGQPCGYLPDSSATALDKRGVRTGQYFIWSPQHFFARVDASGAIVSPNARALIGYFTGDVAPPAGVDVAELSIRASTIPSCAMEVKREGDLGAISSYAPDEPCGCLFDSIATGSTTCATCTDDASCSASAPHCRHGFCEVN